MTVHSWVQSNFPIYFDSELGCGPVLDELHIKNVLCCLLRPQNSRHVCLSCPESQQQLDGHIYQSKSSRYPSFTCFYFVCLHWTVSLSTYPSLPQTCPLEIFYAIIHSERLALHPKSPCRGLLLP